MFPFVTTRCSRSTADSTFVVWIIATLEPRSWATMTIDERPSTSET